MRNERVTGLYFNEDDKLMWIMYTQIYPERISDIDREQYMALLQQLSKTNGMRYDLYKLLVCER